MFGFRPSHTSSPAKSLAAIGSFTVPASDASRTSVASKSELQALPPAEVEFLDAVVKRIPSNATSFLAGLKAYNDELHERGLDSQTETVHYGRLLELCKLRGPSWQAKWDGIKKLYGYVTAPTSSGSVPGTKTPTQASAGQHPLPKPTRSPARLTPVRYDDDDVFTLHSHQEQDQSQTSATTEDDGCSSTMEQDSTQTNLINGHNQARRSVDPARIVGTPASRVSNPILPPSLTRQATPRPQSNYLRLNKVPMWDDNSDATESIIPSPTTTPPSYRAALRGPDTHKTAGPKNQILPRERKGSVINEEDAWKKIKMARDEEDADKFREFKLLERCWETWLLGYQWIITTNQQVTEAHDNVTIGSALRRWHNRTALLLERETHAARVADVRRLRVVMVVWRSKLKEKRQLTWKNEMRAKMKIIKEKRGSRIQKGAWEKWRQTYCARLAEIQFRALLKTRFFLRWRMKVARLDSLEASAVDFSERPSCSAVMCAWKRWRRAMSIRRAEHLVTVSVDLRVKREVMDIWKKRTRDHQLADGFYDVYILKRAVGSWKAARDRIRVMERRADKHLARQDHVLVGAVTRVWKARERGKLLERVRALRLLKNVWSTWQERIRQMQRLYDYAIAFSMRSNSYAVAFALRKWYQVYTIYQNRHAFAVQHHQAHVQYNALLMLRMQLHIKLKLLKHARIVEKFFIQRRMLKAWRCKLEMKRRLEKLRALEICKLQGYMIVWMRRANRRQSLRIAEQQVTGRVITRLMTNALNRWTNRVIDIKLRELEVGQKHSHALLTFAFNKWKNVCLRHVEDLSLMESHLDIKRAETMRRIFHRWLTAARARHQRRVVLHEKELQFDLAVVQIAWEKWRAIYINEKLRPIASQVAIQSQKNLLFRAFGIWLTKTRSLPAIRFRAFGLKQKTWNKWRAVMPQALQAKKAREMYTKAILSRAFERWHKAHQVKRHLKEIARARYLRLPSAIPGQSASASKPTGSLVPVTTRSAFPRRAVRADPDTEESDAGPSRHAVRLTTRAPRTGIASLLSSRASAEPVPRARPKLSSRGARDSSPARSKRSTLATDEPPQSPRPKFGVKRNPSPARSMSSYVREPSPTRSAARLSPVRQGEPERSRLWQELQQVRMRSRPPTERSRSPEPP
ncbi:Sfi1 spindle body protein-domain-containing protein [Scleroderma citrinum]